MHYKIFILISALIITNKVFSQPWINKNQKRNNRNLYHLQNSFKQYWQNITIEKGKGWTQFKRWENFVAPRVYPHGMIPKMTKANLWDITNKLDQNLNYGKWQQYGPLKSPLRINNNQIYGSGRINCIAFHPSDVQTFWIGTPAGGLWKTVNGGQSWQTTTNHLPSIGISEIAIHPENPEILFVATGDNNGLDTYSAGVLKSVDGGNTWQPTGFTTGIEQNIIVHEILIVPYQPNKILITTNEGIYKSDDKGNNWEIIQHGNFRDMKLHLSQRETIYFTGEDNDIGIYKSTDGGKTIKMLDVNVELARRIELAVTPVNPNVVYAVCSHRHGGGFLAFYKSNDSGNTWQLKTDNSRINLLGWHSRGEDSGGQGWYDLTIAVSPKNENEVYVGGINVWKSVDGGANWRLNTYWTYHNNVPTIHADQHELKFHPKTNDLFSANDGGLYVFENNEQWHFLADSLPILQSYKLGLSATDKSVVITGSQDNGTMYYNNDTWNVVLTGDGMECIIDPKDNAVIYTENNNGVLKKSLDNGKSFSNITPDGEYRGGAWVTPFVMSHHDRHTLYAGYSAIYKTTNGGTNWEKITDNIAAGDLLNTIALSPADEGVIYVTSKEKIWRIDENQTYRAIDISDGLPELFITSVTVSHYSSDEIWVSLSGYTNGEKVYKSTNGGKTWENISGELPNLPVNCMVHENLSDNAIYIGTDVGVFYTNDKTDEWIRFSKGLPNIIVSELEIQYSKNGNKIFAATYGQGIWWSFTNPHASFSVNKNEVIENEELTVSSTAQWLIDEYLWNFGEDATPQTATGEGPHTIKFSTAGKKTISLQTKYGNLSSKTAQYDIITVRPESYSVIYPNPANKELSIIFASNLNSEVRIRIINTQGVLISEKKIEKKSTFFSHKINIQNLTNGLYIIELKQITEIVRHKFLRAEF